MFRRFHGEPMSRRYEPLAIYNAEVARGLVHTPEYAARMAKLQHEFDHEVRQQHAGLDWTPPPKFHSP